jgi:hypothetical protein
MGLHDRKTLHLTGCSVQRTAIFTPAQNAAFGPHSTHVFRSWPLNNGMPLTLLATERHQSVIFVTALTALGCLAVASNQDSLDAKSARNQGFGRFCF